MHGVFFMIFMSIEWKIAYLFSIIHYGLCDSLLLSWCFCYNHLRRGRKLMKLLLWAFISILINVQNCLQQRWFNDFAVNSRFMFETFHEVQLGMFSIIPLMLCIWDALHFKLRKCRINIRFAEIKTEEKVEAWIANKLNWSWNSWELKVYKLKQT